MPVEKIAVIGSGLMGHSIAQVIATSGQEVWLVDTSDELLQTAMQRVGDNLNRLAERAKLKESPVTILHRIHTTTSLSIGVKEAEFIIEAVPEDIKLKKQIISDIDARTPKKSIVASNTSGLSITAISEATKRRDKVIGMHWMNPPQVMKLVEVISCKHTNEETLQTTLSLCQRYGKETVIAKKDVWYFLAARARTGWSIESHLMYMSKEADIKEIDAVARYKVGLPMGEFELMDFMGAVDIRPVGVRSTEEIVKTYPDFEPWPFLLLAFKYLVKELWQPMSEKRLSGVKTGKGFYEYPVGKYAKPVIPEELAGNVNPLQLLAPAINIAARCVSDGVGTIEDINKSFRLAFGWPRGIFEFVEEYGITNIIDTLKAKEHKAPRWLSDFYKVDPLLSGWKSRSTESRQKLKNSGVSD